MNSIERIKDKINKDDIEWFGRERFIDDLVAVLTSRNESLHICIDGVWGSGKTTTVLGAINKLNKNDKVEVVYFNTWKYEYFEQPIYALMKVLEDNHEDLLEKIKTIFNDKKIKLGANLNIPLFGMGLEVDFDSKSHTIFNEYEFQSKLIEILIEAIRKYKNELNNKLVIFIDELDRAKPDFVMRLLELFHHFNDDLPTHFVYTVDLGQLNSMIKHYYGFEYNTDIFTHKVFDETYKLQKLNDSQIVSYLENKFKDSRIWSIELLINYIILYSDYYQIHSLRSLNKIVDTTIRDINAVIRLRQQSENNIFLIFRFGFVVYSEFIIAFICYSSVNSLKALGMLNGDEDEILAFYNYLKRKNKNILSQNIEELLKESYLFGKEHHEHDSIEYSDEMYLEGLRKILVVEKNKYGYELISVFEYLNYI